MAKRVSVRQFRRLYDCELVPRIDSSIILGKMAWDPHVGPPRFTHNGMPDHILDGLLRVGEIKKDQYSTYLKTLKNSPVEPAGFADIEVSLNVENVVNIEHPDIGKLNNEFSMERALDFSFGNINAKVLKGLDRIQLVRWLDGVRNREWNSYNIRMRRAFVVTKLYYGEINIEIEKSISNEFEASVAKTDLAFKGKFSLEKSEVWKFENDKLPFAMEIELVKQLA